MVNGIQILCCGGLSLLAFVLLLFKLDRNTIGKKKERERKNSFLSFLLVFSKEASQKELDFWFKKKKKNP